MSLWNPYAFGPTGERTSVSAPPVLRVQGGQMTAAQLSMAQATFVKFCGRSRVSFWQNPNEFGLLPDGSQYRIMTIGSQQFMDVWPQGQSEGVRFLYPFGFTYLNSWPTENGTDEWFLQPSAKTRKCVSHDGVLSSWVLQKNSSSVKPSSHLLQMEDQRLSPRKHAKAWSRSGKKYLFLPAVVGTKEAAIGTYLHGKVSTTSGGAVEVAGPDTSLTIYASSITTPYTELVKLHRNPISGVALPQGAVPGPGPAFLRNAAILHGADRTYDVLTGISLKDYALFTPESAPKFILHIQGPRTIISNPGSGSFNVDLVVRCALQTPVKDGVDPFVELGRITKSVVYGDRPWSFGNSFAGHLAFSPDGSKIVYALYSFTNNANGSIETRDVRRSDGIIAAWEFVFEYDTATKLPRYTIRQVVFPSDSSISDDRYYPEFEIELNAAYDYEHYIDDFGSYTRSTTKLKFKLVTAPLYEHNGEFIWRQRLGEMMGGIECNESKHVIVALINYSAVGDLNVFSVETQYLDVCNYEQNVPLHGYTPGEHGEYSEAAFPESIYRIEYYPEQPIEENGYYSCATGEFNAGRETSNRLTIKCNGANVLSHYSSEIRTSHAKYSSNNSITGFSTVGGRAWVYDYSVQIAKDLFTTKWEIASNNVIFVRKVKDSETTEVAITPSGVQPIIRSEGHRASPPWGAWNPVTDEVSIDVGTTWC